jgi:hypothetical protein
MENKNPTPTSAELIRKLHAQIALVEELEQSKLFEKANYMAERVGRHPGSNHSFREFENDYWILSGKDGSMITAGPKSKIDKWISRRKFEDGMVYFKNVTNDTKV